MGLSDRRQESAGRRGGHRAQRQCCPHVHQGAAASTRRWILPPPPPVCGETTRPQSPWAHDGHTSEEPRDLTCAWWPQGQTPSPCPSTSSEEGGRGPGPARGRSLALAWPCLTTPPAWSCDSQEPYGSHLLGSCRAGPRYLWFLQGTCVYCAAAGDLAGPGRFFGSKRWFYFYLKRVRPEAIFEVRKTSRMIHRADVRHMTTYMFVSDPGLELLLLYKPLLEK